MLRLGNSDGSLGSVTTYQRSGDSWAPVRAVVCGGRDSSVAPPTADALRLGRHGTRPYPPRGLLAPRDDVEPVFVDDRSTYNHAGIVAGHGTLYAFPDEAGLTMVRGTPTSGVTGRLRASATRTEDASDFLFDPDHLVGRVNPFRMWAAYDRTGAIQTLVVSLRDGSTIRGRTFTHPSWDGGVLHLVLAPRETAESVRVVPAAR